MELKQGKKPIVALIDYLLIVPYGIETSLNKPLNYRIVLLIVPYGIET